MIEPEEEPHDPIGPGWYDSDEGKVVADRVTSLEFDLARLQQAHLQQSIRFARLYFAERPDRRGKDEKWRANLWWPEAYELVETQSAAMMEIIMSADPPIQAAVSKRDFLESARATEMLLSKTLDMNTFSDLGLSTLRMANILGTAILKDTFLTETWTSYEYKLSPEDVQYWESIVAEAASMSGGKGGVRAPDWRLDPMAFELWRDLHNKAWGHKLWVPDRPKDSIQVTPFRGPKLSAVSLYDLRLDPNIESLQDQPAIQHVIYRSTNWLLAHSGDDPEDPNRPFCREAVEESLDQTPTEIPNDLDQELRDILHMDNQQLGPASRKSGKVRLIEQWARRDERTPYTVVYNNRVINHHPDRYPFLHHQHPFTAMRPVVISGFAYGLPELSQVESIILEGVYLRNHRQDAVTLGTMPILLRSGTGASDIQKKLTPGAIVDVPYLNPQSLRWLTENYRPPNELFQDMSHLSQDSSNALGIGAQMRGQTASVGRIAATTEERRYGQAMIRLKWKTIPIEIALSNGLPVRLISNWFQYGDREEYVTAAGGRDYQVTKQDLMSSLELRFSFKGASRSMNRSEIIQAAYTLAKSFGGDMDPQEKRRLLKLVLETLNVRELEGVMDEEATQVLQGEWSARHKSETQKLQAESQSSQAPPEIPGEVPEADLQAMLGVGAPTAAAPQAQAPAGPVQE
jgi:hypothetical protein